MKIFLLLLIICSFLQSAFLGVNFVLVLIVARSLVSAEKSNLYLAFTGGLILSFLTQVNLGYWPFVLLLVSKVSSLAKELPFSLNPVMVFLTGVLQVVIVALFSKFYMHANMDVSIFIIETLLIVAVYYLMRVWEERFIVRREIKLKV